MNDILMRLPCVVDGGAGDDCVTGSADGDTLVGGSGSDTFTDYSQTQGDSLLDFSAGEGDQTNVPCDTDDASISIGDIAMNEGTGGTTTFTFSLTLSTIACCGAVSVDFATADGSATTSDGDFAAATGTLIFPENETIVTVTVTIAADAKYESDEFFYVNLSNAVGATLSDDQVIATIVNDDIQPFLSIDVIAAYEGHTGVTVYTFTVSISNASYQTVTVSFATEDGSAVVGDGDYTAASGILTFNPGETSKTISVFVMGDTSWEGDEEFFVNLSNADGAMLPAMPGQGLIWNDDTI